MNKRMNRERLNIGVYHLRPYARTEAHIRDLKDCGIDFVVCMDYDKPTLDLMEQYGIGAIVSGVVPGWWGGDGDNAGKMEASNPMEKYDEAAEQFVDHPAIWAIDAGDEPSALDFPYYGKVLRRIEQKFPNQFAYLNLYPNYASVSQNNAAETVNQLGTPTYAEHIDQYCKQVGADYLCYDFYMYSASVAGAYENLRIAADACLRTGRSLWIVLQVNSSRPDRWISENQLRFQAYSAMAFGVENITWACYTAGWWHNQVLDEKGEKTEQYEKLKKVNAEIRVLAEEYMKYRRVATHFIGFETAEELRNVHQKPIKALDTGVFQDVHAENGENLVVGQMVSRKESEAYALFLCGADDPMDVHPKTYRVIFRADDREVTVLSSEGTVPVIRQTDGSYSIEIKSSSGVLITAK
ncbi:MAG: hypothetical protein ACI4V1_01785 [Eubacteriales bacterium]